MATLIWAGLGITWALLVLVFIVCAALAERTRQLGGGIQAMTDAVLSDPPRNFRVETDRYIVLLSCQHWTHTRRPWDSLWPCPVHGYEVTAARDHDTGQAAVLEEWFYADRTKEEGK